MVLALIVVAGTIAGVACGTAGSSADPADPSTADDLTDAAIELTDAEVSAVGMERAVVVTGTTCGDAFGSIGSGVVVGPDRVLTAAHVIAGLDEIEVSIRSDHPAQASPDGTGDGDRTGDGDGDTGVASVPATVFAFDRLRDLALLEADLSQWPTPATESTYLVLGPGDTGVIVGGVTSGDVDFTIAEKIIIATDEVRGDRRSERSGYRVDAETASGDSGAGLYGRTGDLAGMLFAVSTDDGGRSWATASDEIQAFLADPTVAGRFACNPDRSIVEPR